MPLFERIALKVISVVGFVTRLFLQRKAFEIGYEDILHRRGLICIELGIIAIGAYEISGDKD